MHRFCIKTGCIFSRKHNKLADYHSVEHPYICWLLNSTHANSICDASRHLTRLYPASGASTAQDHPSAISPPTLHYSHAEQSPRVARRLLPAASALGPPCVSLGCVTASASADPATAAAEGSA